MNPRYIIIGAGPAGLDMALSLANAGVDTNLISIIDSRAGEYTRVGELLWKTFNRAESRLNIKFDQSIFQIRPRLKIDRLERTPPIRYAHICDLEKKLYSEVIARGIVVEKKCFIGLDDSHERKGIIVRDLKDSQEFIPADYVFDCTGSSRRIIEAVNQLYPDPPFQLQNVTSMPINMHFLGYVQMDIQDFRTIKNDLNDINDLSFARQLLELHKLFGWNEFDFPDCWGGSFGKDKACFYIEMPDPLEKEKHALMFEKNLALYGPLAKYQRLPETEEHPRKTTFTAFPINTNVLKQFSHKTNNGLIILPSGDSQIDPHFNLAHGIYNNMLRIDAMIACMEIRDGKIHAFNDIEYMEKIDPLITMHKKELKAYASDRKRSLMNAAKNAIPKFKNAIHLTDDPNEKTEFATTLSKLEKRFLKNTFIENRLNIYTTQFCLFESGRNTNDVMHSILKLLTNDIGFKIRQLFIALMIKEFEMVLSIHDSAGTQIKMSPNASY